MTTQTQHSVQLRRVYAANPETVFAAWTEPDRLRQWFCPEGAQVRNVEVDLRVGGRYLVLMRSPKGTHTARGRYREIDPPHRLSFTWDWDEEESRMGETLVTVEFKRLDTGTEVRVSHELFPDAENAAGHEQGWESCLSRLDQLLESSQS